MSAFGLCSGISPPETRATCGVGQRSVSGGCGFRLRHPELRLSRAPTGSAARRAHVGASSTEEERDVKEKRIIVERVHSAQKILNEMVCEVCGEMLLSGGLEEDPILKVPYQEEVIATVVGKHLNDLDQNFLAVLDVFEKEATNEMEEMGKVIGRIRKEVLKQITRRLSPEVQLVEDLMGIAEKRDRVELITRQTLSSSNSQTSINNLIGVSHQYIMELEENMEIVDRKLLAKLCIIREEARLLQLEDQYRHPEEADETIRLVGDSVSSHTMSFLQQLMPVGLTAKRTALLQKAFEKDCFGKKQEGENLTQDEILKKNYANDVVRPGNFMACLAATQAEMDRSPNVPEVVLKRVEDIRQEAMFALRLMAWGDFTNEEIEDQERSQQDMEEFHKKVDDMDSQPVRPTSFLQVSSIDEEEYDT